MDDQQELILVDGSSWLFQAFYAVQSLTTQAGQPTGAIYGTIAMLRKMLAEHPHSLVAVVFDARGGSFRNRLYPEYKANRGEMPDELAGQIEPLHQIIDAMGLCRLVVPGVEADDVIGTLARRAEHSHRVLIISPDKDLTQLVSERITLFDAKKNRQVDRAGVKEKFGVAPEQMVDYLALVGDASDNVPGVAMCGPKTAAKWLQTYGDIDTLLARADEVGGKVGDNLRASVEQLRLSRELVTLRCDLELETSLEDLQPQAPDTQALVQWYQRLEFKSWLKDLTGAPDDAGQPINWELVLDKQALASWVERLASAEFFALDTETTSLDYMQAELVGISFALPDGSAAYVPFGHDYLPAPEQLDRQQVLETLRPLLEDANLTKLGHNLKYDMSVLAGAGITLRGVRLDTMLESYVVNSTGNRHNMDALALKLLDYKTISYEEVAGKGKQQITFNQVPLAQAGPYAAEDAQIALRLHEHLWPQLKADAALHRVFTEIEMPLLPILSRIERTGTLIDRQALEQQSRDLAASLAVLCEQAYQEAGEEFNLGSTKQLQQILYEKKKLNVIRKTPGGAPSTAESVLEELAHQHLLPRIIMDYRHLSKLKSTYTDKLPQQINPSTNRVHTSYHQAVVATGRLSSSGPNLQNIPIRTEAGRRIRKAFVAPPGRILLAADYSQIELRIMAHLSQDEGLLAAFAEGLDVHRATAAEVFDVAADAVTDEHRRRAKAINFGLIYGMSAFGLARQLGIEQGDARDYMQRYFERYPKVNDYMQRTRECAKEQGYVETVFGRRLYLPAINDTNQHRRSAAERAAINAPMQGTAADIIKLAMIGIDGWLQQSAADAAMVMQVHDELVLEVARADADKVAEAVSHHMQSAAQLKVPLLVTMGRGENWDEAH